MRTDEVPPYEYPEPRRSNDALDPRSRMETTVAMEELNVAAGMIISVYIPAHIGSTHDASLYDVSFYMKSPFRKHVRQSIHTPPYDFTSRANTHVLPIVDYEPRR